MHALTGEGRLGGRAKAHDVPGRLGKLGLALLLPGASSTTPARNEPWLWEALFLRSRRSAYEVQSLSSH
jgi:hypothetical protein